MLASSFGRHGDKGSFEEFEQGLLNTFATDITGYGGVLALARNLINFVDEYNAALTS